MIIIGFSRATRVLYCCEFQKTGDYIRIGKRAFRRDKSPIVFLWNRPRWFYYRAIETCIRGIQRVYDVLQLKFIARIKRRYIYIYYFVPQSLRLQIRFKIYKKFASIMGRNKYILISCEKCIFFEKNEIFHLIGNID